MKKKLSVSNSELKIAIVLISLVIFAGAYFLVFQKSWNTAADIEESNNIDRQTVAKLQEMVDNKENIEASTDEYKQAISDILAKYPADVTTEKAITIIQDVEENTQAHVSAINFVMDNLLSEVKTVTTDDITASKQASANTTVVSTTDSSTEDTEATTDEASADTSIGSISYYGLYAMLSMNYEAEYESFKNTVNYINKLEDRTTIPSISAKFDNESGTISGVITVYMYYLDGGDQRTDRTYDAPNPGIESGVGDIFSSSTVKKARVTDDEDTDADATATDDADADATDATANKTTTGNTTTNSTTTNNTTTTNKTTTNNTTTANKTTTNNTTTTNKTTTNNTTTNKSTTNKTTTNKTTTNN